MRSGAYYCNSCVLCINAYGQFHGNVDMALKFQLYHIAKELLIMYYPYIEVKETQRIISIGQIFPEKQLQMLKTIFQSSKLLKCMLNLI